MEIKTLPLEGRIVPHAIWLLAKADKNVESIPITSPVDFISGPRIKSTPSNLLKGNTDSLTLNVSNFFFIYYR